MKKLNDVEIAARWRRSRRVQTPEGVNIPRSALVESFLFTNSVIPINNTNSRYNLQLALLYGCQKFRTLIEKTRTTTEKFTEI